MCADVTHGGLNSENLRVTSTTHLGFLVGFSRPREVENYFSLVLLEVTLNGESGEGLSWRITRYKFYTCSSY